MFLFNLFLFLLFNFYVIIVVLVGISFVTLLERKILGYIHFRLGPSKVGFYGIFQPFSDAIKLFSKSFVLLFFYSYIYFISPILMLLIMAIMWFLFPLGGILSLDFMLLLVVSFMGLMVYPLMLGGWFSGSLYSMIGSIRSVAQMISYEVSFIMLILSLVFLMDGSFNMIYFIDLGGVWWNIFVWVPIFISLLIDMNRSPVDLIEGESELVSGFNTEYFGYGFSFIFLGEYGIIMFFGGLCGFLMWGLGSYFIFGSLMLLLFVILIVFIRGILPRVRYDELMYVCWTSILSVSLGVLSLVVGFSSMLK